MTKIIKICDKCKQEVDWLYEIPFMFIEGLHVGMYTEGDRVQEFCRECTSELFDKFNHYSKNK